MEQRKYTFKNTLLRINSYGKSTKIYSVKTVSDSKLVEKEIIKQFKSESYSGPMIFFLCYFKYLFEHNFMFI